MRTVILGDGGHAQALSDLTGVEVFITDDDEVQPDDVVLIGVGDIAARRRLYEKFKGQVGEHGVQLMKGAIVYGSAVLGANVVVNTGAQIDHDCVIGSHCVIAPGAILCGGVMLGEACFIGAGAIIVEDVTLDPGTFVPAGTLCCGQDDFRKPIPMVREHGENYALVATHDTSLETRFAIGHRVYSNPQPRGPADGAGAAERPGPDPRKP